MKERSRILICTGIFSPDIGGPASYALTFGTKLSEKYDVTVMAYSDKWSVADDKNYPFRVVRIWRKNFRILRYLRYYLRARREARKTDLVVALNASSAGVPALRAARAYKKKFIVKIVGDRSWEWAINMGKTFLMINDFQKLPKYGWAKILHKVQIWVCKNSSGIIVPSEYLKGIVSEWGIDKKKIHVVYNGTDFKPLDISKEEARKKIGIAGTLIISVGRLVPWKGFKMLIKIMPKLLDINQFFRLVIVGDGPDEEILKKMIKNMGLENKVFIVGRKNKQDVALYLAASEMFVLNTGYEGFSHQIIEAMAAGLPVITTGVGGNREIINQGTNGFMVRYNDEFNLIEAIRTVYKIDEMRERFIEEGKKTAEHFSSERMYNETTSLVEEFLLPHKFENLR
jgi:glycosyltransferase involved in cell wall biosynthesis